MSRLFFRLRLSLLSLLPLTACEQAPTPPKAVVHTDKLAAARTPEALIALGDAALRAERWFEAAEAYRLAQVRGSTQAAVMGALAITYLELGDPTSAGAQLELCMRQEAPEPACLYVAGLLMRQTDQLGRLKRAEQAFEKMLQLAPKHALAARARGELSTLRREISQREEAGERVAEADPHATPGATPQKVGALNAFGAEIQAGFEAMQRGDVKASEAAYRRALKIHKRDVTAEVGLAEALYVQERLSEAAEHIAIAYEQDKDNGRVAFSFGLIMLGQERRVPEALAAWRELLKRDPELAKAVDLAARLKDAEARLKSGQPPNPDIQPSETSSTTHE